MRESSAAGHARLNERFGLGTPQIHLALASEVAEYIASNKERSCPICTTEASDQRSETISMELIACRHP